MDAGQTGATAMRPGGVGHDPAGAAAKTSKDGLQPYLPLNTLKPIAPDVWIVDGPTIRFGYSGLSLPFPTRMTLVRTPAGLFVHSPTALTPDLRAAVDAIGPVAWIVGPNRLHYWWLQEWRDAYPNATAFVAPRLPRQAGSRLAPGATLMEQDHGYPWDLYLKTLPVVGHYMTEVVFLHRASRTLLLTDLIENFEPERLGSWVLRRLTQFAGVQAPHGGLARDLRITFPRGPLRQAVERILGWKPERIVIAHGRWFPREGEAHLRRAFHWLLR